MTRNAIFGKPGDDKFEFVMTGRGIQLLDVYLGPQGMLTGSARLRLEIR